MRGARLIPTLLCLSFLLTGCWDRNELNDIGIEVGKGIDEVPGHNLRVSSQIIIPSRLGSMLQGQGPSGKSFYVASGTGKTVFEAIKDMQNNLSRKLFRGLRRNIFIGEGLAKRGLKDVLETFTRDADIRLRTDIWVVKGHKALDLLRLSYPFEPIPVIAALKIRTTVGGASGTGFLDFLRAANSETSYPTLPVIDVVTEPQDQGKAKTPTRIIRFYGRAIFDKNLRLLGYMNFDEAAFRFWILGNLRLYTVAEDIPQLGTFSVYLTNLKAKVKPVLRKTGPSFKIELKANGVLLESNSRLDLSNTKNLNLVNHALDKALAKRILQFVLKVRKEYNADIFGFDEAVHKKHPLKWKKMKRHWDQEFQKAKFVVAVNLDIKRIGITRASLIFRESEIKK